MIQREGFSYDFFDSNDIPYPETKGNNDSVLLKNLNEEGRKDYLKRIENNK